MAKKRTKTQAETTDKTSETEPVAVAEPQAAARTVTDSAPEQVTAETPNERRYASDPHATITVSLSDYRGGPSMHLLRSQQFNQMQIRFDGEQPGEQSLAMLARAGWKDRTESEGVWTKQIDRNARWQSVQQMEREFRDIANAIRRDKGLEPALTGMAVV